MKLIYIIYGFLSTYFFIKLSLPFFFKKNIIDIPDKRSSHKRPTPTGGGIVFPLQSIFVSVISGDFVTLICIPLSIVGLIDDKLNISSKIRFLVQILTASLMLYFYPDIVHNFKDIAISEIILIPFLIFCFTAFFNFINFMDGIDGLVGSCILFGFLFIGIKNDPLIFVIVGSILGFLRWNWNPAKIFMGDVGSTFLASYFLLSLIKSDNLNDSLGIFLILSPLTIDALICILKRFCYGENIFRPHKLHLYQRLFQAGLSHSKVSILYSSACLLLGITFNIFGIYYLLSTIVFLIIIGVFLDKKFAISFKDSLNMK